jgi:hypothetical protein
MEFEIATGQALADPRIRRAPFPSRSTEATSS